MTVYPTTTALSESLSSALVGTSVSFTATVTSTGSPTGNVAFLDGSTVLATLPLASGTAIYTTSSLLLGQHQMQAVYLGSGTYTESASAGVWGNNTIFEDVGIGAQGYSGDGNFAGLAVLDSPSGMAFDKYGDLFIADPGDNVVREVNTAGIINTYAGNGTAGFSGNGGLATSAMLDQPSAIAMNAAGDLFIADGGNHVVREVTPAGIISTYAGNGTSGYSGDGGQASAAEMSSPSGFAFDAAGAMFIADNGGNVVREVTPSGVISTFAGTGTSGYTGDGGPAILSRLSGPSGLAFDALGNLFIADSNNNVIREVTLDGQINTDVGDGTAGYTGDAGQASTAQLHDPTSIAFDSRGDLFIADTANNVVREVVATGAISTLAGTGTAGYSGNNSSANTAELQGPQGVAFASSGQLLIADSLNHVVRQIYPRATTLYVATGYPTSITLSDSQTSTLYGTTIRFTATVASGNGVPTGSVTFMSGSTVFGTANLINGVAVLSTSIAVGSYQVAALFNGSGTFYSSESAAVSPSSVMSSVAGNGSYGYTGDGGQATSAELKAPRGFVLDAAGNIYIADTGNNVIRKVTLAGVISTVAGNGTSSSSGDGGPATSAGIWQPTSVVFNSAGDMFISQMIGSEVREVTPSGAIYAFAGNGTPGYSGDGGPATSAQIGIVAGLAVDAAGDLFFGDSTNNVIREINTAGIISTVVGNGSHGYSGDDGLATGAELNEPVGIAFNSTGDMFIADSGNNVIREVTPSGIITTVVGTGAGGYLGDGGPATSAELNSPVDVACDALGDLFISDTGNKVVREVSHSGIISTLAGTGISGGSGNSGPSGAAQLRTPRSLAFNSAGDLLIADSNNNEIRELLAPLGGALPLSVLAAPTTTTLVVTAGPSSTALEALVSSSSAATVDVGNVAFYDGGALLGVSPVVNGQAMLETVPLSTGQHTLVAVFSGDENLTSSSAQQSVTVGSTTAGPTTVVGLSRYGVGNQPTLVSLFFDQTLNPAEALWKHNYKLHNNYGERINISHIYFDQPSSTVTLLPARRFALENVYTLKLLGLNSRSGSRGASPTVSSNGWLARSFKAKINDKALARPGSPPAVTFVNGQEVPTHGSKPNP